MNLLQAQTLHNIISRQHPELLPGVRQLDGGECIVVLQQRLARKTVAFMHFWSMSDWYEYQRRELLQQKKAIA